MVQRALNEEQIEWAYEKFCIGYTLKQIAAALFVSERTIQRALKGRPRKRPALNYFPFKGNDER